MKDLFFLFGGLALLAGIWYLVFVTNQQPVGTTSIGATSTVAAITEGSGDITASYLCNNDIMLTATFHVPKETEGSATDAGAEAGEKPRPGGSVSLINSDGIKVDLQQTISASGARYADPTEQFVFWSKGNSAQILEHGADSLMYQDCIVVAPSTDELPQMFYSKDPLLSLRYPTDWQTGDTGSEALSGLSDGVHVIAQFTVPSSLTEGTNLSTDSGVRIARLEGDTCSPERFLRNTDTFSTTTMSGTTYMVASTTDAGAGNRYELSAYVQEFAQPCIAVIDLVHTTVLENYPEGTVREHDAAKLREEFTAILNTVRVD